MDSEINLDASNVVVEYEKGKGSYEDTEDGVGDCMNLEEDVQKGDGNNQNSSSSNEKSVAFGEEGGELVGKGVDVGIDDELRGLVLRNNNDNDETTSSPTTGIRQRKPSELKSRGSYFKNVGDNLGLRDHFTLSNPSSHVSFFDHEAVVYVGDLEQITLEKKKDDTIITAKQSSTASPGVLFLRILYTLQAFLVASFLLVFCMEAVFFLFLGVVIGSGLTSSSGFNVLAFFGTLAAFPVFIIGLSQIMVFAQTFVLDTWKGSTFLLSVTRWDSWQIEWIVFTAYLGLPTLIGTISLLSDTSKFWVITLLSWLIIVSLLFAAFSVAVIYCEVKACFDLVRIHPELRNGDRPDNTESFFRIFCRLCLFRSKQKLSGYETVRYLASGSNDTHPDQSSYDEIKNRESVTSSFGLLNRFKKLPCVQKHYIILDNPIRQHSVGDVIDHTSYLTKSSWGLESVFCRNRTARFVAVVDGESSLKNSQAKSSLWFFGIAIFLLCVVALSVLVWLIRKVLPVGIVLLVIGLFFAILAILCIVPFRGLWEVAKEYKNVLMLRNGSLQSIKQDGESNTMWQVQDTFRVSEPSKKQVYIIDVIITTVLFSIFPCVSIFASRNIRIGLLFIVLNLLTVARDICSVPACLRELGSLDEIQVSRSHEQNRTEWREKHRLGKILNETSLGKRSNFWAGFILIFMLLMGIAIVICALVGLTLEKKKVDMNFANKNEFVYSRSKFASCSFPDNFQSPEGGVNAMVDFAFLALMADYQDEVTNSLLSEWFEEDSFTLSDTVNEFQQAYRKKHGDSSVTYKLIDLPQADLKILTIRGTKSMWDVASDAQLWFPVIFFQLVRFVLPFSDLFTPVLPHLIEGVTRIEDTSLEEVSYYKETSSFVGSLQEKSLNVQIVGHSLGGGLAMISGAQKQVPAVAVSGPNNIMSRLTFSPQLEVEDLNKYTFNIIPDKDPFPRVDIPAEHYKRINCRAPFNDFKNFCHFIESTLCELLYTCGSLNRPIPCECVNRFKYEPPKSINGKNFAEECPAK